MGPMPCALPGPVLEDVGKHWWAQEAIQRVRDTITFITRHQMSTALFAKACGKKLLKPGQAVSQLSSLTTQSGCFQTLSFVLAVQDSMTCTFVRSWQGKAGR